MYIKKLLGFLGVIVALQLSAQTTTVEGAGKIRIEGQIKGAAKQTVILGNQNLGGINSPIAKVQTDGKGRFTIDTTIALSDYYFISTENQQFVNLTLRPNDNIKLQADGDKLIETAVFEGSDASNLMNRFFVEHQVFKKIEDSLRNVLKASPDRQNEINAWFKPHAERFLGYRNAFIQENLNSPALIATLNAINQDREWELYKYVVKLLTVSFGESPTIKNIAQYVSKKEAQKKQQKLAEEAKNSLFKPGTLAKEIELPDTTGNLLKLSSLRGNIVLIDFWASWCGPCRRENPNVVKAYEKYNKDGFEVYSVSLDKAGARSRWVDAIHKDGLIWPSHVSDLKGWGSAAAQDYEVHSIPFTVLIDREGKIIGTNLRGPRLEAELKRIFGY